MQLRIRLVVWWVALSLWIFAGLSAAETQPSSCSDVLCGPQSLLAVCRILNVQSDLQELMKLSDFSETAGTDLAGLEKAAEAKGLHAIGVKIGIERIAAAGIPAIAHQWGNHFVVVEAGDPGAVRVTDPPSEPHNVPLDDFKKSYSGFALLVAKDESALPICETTGPDLRFDSYSYDFGSIEEDEQTQHAFVYENKGDAELVLSKADTSCGCTSASLTEERRVPPGGKGELIVGFDATGRSAWQAEAVYIHSNDPISPIVQIAMGGVVKPFRLMTSTRSLHFGAVRKRDSTRQRVIIRDPGDGSLRVTDVASGSPFIKVSLAGTPARPGDYTVSVELQPGAPLGELKTSITVLTNHPREPVVEIPIEARIIGDLRAFPEQFYLPAVKKGQTVSRTITITTSADEPLVIRKLKSPLKYLKLSLKPDIEGKQYSITAALKNNAPIGLLESEVIIRTNDKDQPEITVPLFAAVEE